MRGPGRSSSQPTGETPETIAGVRLGERVADYSGNFYVAESVSISDEAVSVGGSFWISGIEAKRFYAFADFNYRDPIVSGDSAELYGSTDFYPIAGFSSDSSNRSVTVQGDAMLSFPVDGSFISLFRSKECIRLRISLGIVGTNSDAPNQLVVGKEEINFIS